MFFLLMGFLCFYSRFGEDLYRTARNWCGHFRGGLAIASVCACTALGAVVGDALVGCIAMMTIALPEMRRHGYDDKLAISTLACSAASAASSRRARFIIYGVPRNISPTCSSPACSPASCAWPVSSSSS
ncbi:MAG: TRAP transporter large permease subunit [Bilophila wadsworthia]